MDLDKYFKFEKNLTWPEVFRSWHRNEKNNEHWQKLYQQRGFKNWHDWRSTYAIPLMLDKLEWSLYEINNPLLTVPNFYGGPFSTWKKYYYKDKVTMPYKDLLDEKILNRISGKVYQMLENYPADSLLIGLIHHDDIVIVEGTHRCLAISLRAKNKLSKDVFNKKIRIALAKSKLDKLPIVGGMK